MAEFQDENIAEQVADVNRQFEEAILNSSLFTEVFCNSQRVWDPALERGDCTGRKPKSYLVKGLEDKRQLSLDIDIWLKEEMHKMADELQDPEIAINTINKFIDVDAFLAPSDGGGGHEGQNEGQAQDQVAPGEEALLPAEEDMDTSDSD